MPILRSRLKPVERSTERGPHQIRFHGQILDFTAEVRYLLADETATTSLGEEPVDRGNQTNSPASRQLIALTLDRFAQAGRGRDAYAWLVTPSPDLDDKRPIELLGRGEGEVVLSAVEQVLAA